MYLLEIVVYWYVDQPNFEIQSSTCFLFSSQNTYFKSFVRDSWRNEAFHVPLIWDVILLDYKPAYRHV
jgi:hypothetical protein